MRNAHRTAIATVVVIVCAALAGPAIAAPPIGRGVLQPPQSSYRGHSPGYWLSQWWAAALSAPADEDNPAIAGGCVIRGKVAIHYGGDCTVRPGTSIFEMLFSTECSTLEDPPFHAENAAEAEACGRANAGLATALDLRVDGGPSMHLLDPSFSAVMPFITITLPENNLYDLPAGPMSFGGYGYGALVKPLRPGRHTIDFHPEGEGSPPDVHSVITVR